MVIILSNVWRLTTVKNNFLKISSFILIHLLKWQQFLELGNTVLDMQLQDRIRTIAPNKCACLVYTVTNLYFILLFI